ncbi:MAG: PEP-utilizing enzyme, partial [Acidimicrobiales bacterium]
GEILVCRFTDPSWAPLFTLAEALVIDIGAAASHGAIVARELGVPCVIGTGDGTRRIRTGDRLHVDGSGGRVQILERAGEP